MSVPQMMTGDRLDQQEIVFNQPLHRLRRTVAMIFFEQIALRLSLY
jgi:hypothetical protein